MDRPQIEIYADAARGCFVAAYPEDSPQATALGCRLQPLSHNVALPISEIVALVAAERPDYEVRALVCVECGAGVWFGSGNYVNRIVNCDTVEENRENGLAYPYGTHTCARCEHAYWEELAADGEACAEHERRLEDGACPDCVEVSVS
jgi:hypothetical protein